MKKLLFVLFVLPFTVHSQTVAGNADALLNAYYKQDQFVGTVLIAKEGKIIFEKGYGEADRTSHLTNTPTTEFRIGSVSKTFTAALIMKLEEKGLLSVKDPLKKYIPDYPKGDSIRLEHLLNHTSGIRSITSMKQYYAQWIKEPATLATTVSRFQNEASQFSPGAKFEYSNSNYILLSYIAELATGSPFEKLLQEYIFKPLKLNNTGLDKNDRTATNKAIGYDAAPDNDFAVARFNDMSIMAGAGSVYSTVKDLYKWDRALYGEAFLSAASKKQMFMPYLNHYGFGWEVDTVNGRRQISHSGSIDGFLSNIIRYPEQDVCIIFLSNYFVSKGAQISKALTAIAFGEAYELPKERKFITLPANKLQTYTGQYEMEKGPTISVFVEDGKLKGRLGQQAPFYLLAESETRFYIKVIDTDVLFVTGVQGEIGEMKMQQKGKTLSFKKI